MKISVVVSACDNRIHLFTMALDTWASQTMPKDDFELLVLDDAKRDDLKQLCESKALSLGLNIQFIRVDKAKSAIPVKSFTPALTNNVGFRNSRGDVVVITGPETLQANTNLEVAWGVLERKECAYGLVYRANLAATEYILKGWGRLKSLPISHLLQIPGAKAACHTMPPHPPAYWYFMAVAKRYVERIRGVDERFLGGLCAEDDDFANRMRMSGIEPVFEHRIVGIHQDHSREDHNDGIHVDRNQGSGYFLRTHNIALMKDNIAKGDPVANAEHEWGDNALITLHEFYGNVKGVG